MTEKDAKFEMYLLSLKGRNMKKILVIILILMFIFIFFSQGEFVVEETSLVNCDLSCKVVVSREYVANKKLHILDKQVEVQKIENEGENYVLTIKNDNYLNEETARYYVKRNLLYIIWDSMKGGDEG